MEGMKDDYFVRTLVGLQFPKHYDATVVKLWDNLLITAAGIETQEEMKRSRKLTCHQNIAICSKRWANTWLANGGEMREVMPTELIPSRVLYNKLVRTGKVAQSKMTKNVRILSLPILF